MSKKVKILFILSLLYGILALPNLIHADNENINKLENKKMTVGFTDTHLRISVRIIDFTTGERITEFYNYTKSVKEIEVGETIDVKLRDISNSPALGISGESGNTYTYKDKSGDIVAFNANSNGLDKDSYILLFNYTNKTLTKEKMFKKATVQLDKNYTYDVSSREYPEQDGIYSIFTNSKLGNDVYSYTNKIPRFWDKYSISVTPRDYIIPLSKEPFKEEKKSYVKIRPDGTTTNITSLAQISNNKGGSFVINVSSKVKVEGIIGGVLLTEKMPNYFYRVEGNTRTLLNKNKVTNSNIILSPDNKYALIVEAYPTKSTWKYGNPEKVILSIYDIVNNKLIKTFQSPASLPVSLEYMQWYSNTLVRLSFQANLPTNSNYFYLHLPTGLMTYQGREKSDYFYQNPTAYISNNYYMTADTNNLITMQDPYYVMIDGEYIKYAGQGAFEYNNTVYIPVIDFCSATGIEILKQPNKWLLNKNSLSAEINLKDSRIIQINEKVFAPAIDFVEKMGFKDKPGSYRGDLDLISFP